MYILSLNHILNYNTAGIEADVQWICKLNAVYESYDIPLQIIDRMLQSGLNIQPLLHRDDKLKEMCMLIECNIPFVYITGPPNSGKSNCLDHAVAKVEDNQKIG